MYYAVTFALIITMGLALARAIIGPSVYDRVLAMNMFGTKTVLLLAVAAFILGRPDFLDLALIYALINFIGVLAVLEFFQDRAARREDENDTTTTPIRTKEGSSSSENDCSGPEFATWVPDELREAALGKVARLSPVMAQIVIDEWAGSMAGDLIETSPVGYLHAMVSRYEEGDFRLKFADAVARIRSMPPDTPDNIISIEACEASSD